MKSTNIKFDNSKETPEKQSPVVEKSRKQKNFIIASKLNRPKDNDVLMYGNQNLYILNYRSNPKFITFMKRSTSVDKEYLKNKELKNQNNFNKSHSKNMRTTHFITGGNSLNKQLNVRNYRFFIHFQNLSTNKRAISECQIKYQPASVDELKNASKNSKANAMYTMDDRNGHFKLAMSRSKEFSCNLKTLIKIIFLLYRQ